MSCIIDAVLEEDETVMEGTDSYLEDILIEENIVIIDAEVCLLNNIIKGAFEGCEGLVQRWSALR